MVSVCLVLSSFRDFVISEQAGFLASYRAIALFRTSPLWGEVGRRPGEVAGRRRPAGRVVIRGL